MANASNSSFDSLRFDLKRWEKQFAAANNGRSASREDIKQDTAIAWKYKEYNKFRDVASGKSKQAQAPSKQSVTRKAVDIPSPQKHKTSKHTSTTEKQHLEVSSAQEGDKENNTPLAKRTFIDPTPQKDGRVLGLLDLIPDDEPAKGASSQAREALGPQDPNAVLATPTRRNIHQQFLAPDASLIASTPHTSCKQTRTPQSSTKRFLLDTFLTPSKRQKLDDATTPSLTRKLDGSNTPAFLSRFATDLPAAAEEDNATVSSFVARDWQPRGLKRMGLTRSLSTMIADMRQAEEDKLDEEMDILREMEEEEEHVTVATSLRTHTHVQPAMLVADSQVLGPDGSGPLSDDEESRDNIGKDGKPLKVWKKKGQKRQTRRVILRPTTKPKYQHSIPETTDEIPSDVEKAHITPKSPPAQRRVQIMPKTDSDDDNINDSDFDGLDADDQDDNNEHSPTKKRNFTPADDTLRAAGPGGLVKKAMKKISATAHANFCRLKIRSSKGAKAAMAERQSGFRRRRIR